MRLFLSRFLNMGIHRRQNQNQSANGVRRRAAWVSYCLRHSDISLMFIVVKPIDRSHVIEADALLVRTITQVNRELLEHTSVRFVGSATSGIDHIDVPYLKTNNMNTNKY